MKEKHIHILSILMTLFLGAFVVWVYWAAPNGVSDATSKIGSAFQNAATQAQVITNTYSIDQEKFDAGLREFRADNFVVARDFFERADTGKRDAKTRFYIAYSYYREGWGRFTNDDELFQKGLEQINIVIEIDNDFENSDSDLGIKYPVELKNELQEGLRITAEDFNPSKLLRTRK